MYKSLFALAGFGIFAWLLLIFFPTWRVTRRMAESALVPVYVALLYLVGVIAVFRDMGFGVMADFGTADGVLGLLRTEPVALVAWIHILAFDQVVAHLIYRDNMRHRFVPIPVQSVMMFLTLMLGPLGFLSYYVVRTARSRELLGWGERTAAEQPPQRESRFADVMTERSLVPAVLQLWRQEARIVQVAGAAMLLAVIAAVLALIGGDWIVAPAGRLKDAMRFDAALTFYLLTLALIVPFAGFDAQEKRSWQRWLVGLATFSLAVENVQVWRGLDPRFAPNPVDQAIGGVFFLAALGIMLLFIQLSARFFRDTTLSDHPALRIAMRYASVGAFMAFAVGIVMSGLRTRFIGGGGNMMLLHAGGFHGLQAVPLVALLAGWSAMSVTAAVRAAHVAGGAWLILCAALAAQAFTSQPPLAPGAFNSLAAAMLLVWVGALAYAAVQPRAKAARAAA